MGEKKTHIHKNNNIYVISTSISIYLFIQYTLGLSFRLRVMIVHGMWSDTVVTNDYDITRTKRRTDFLSASDVLIICNNSAAIHAVNYHDSKAKRWSHGILNAFNLRIINGSSYSK